jgi:hypothetical protein
LLSLKRQSFYSFWSLETFQLKNGLWTMFFKNYHIT